MAMSVFARNLALRVLSRKLVTPFTGYVLSNYYLSSEVGKHGLEFLNPKSQDLRASNLSNAPKNSIVYVQVNQLDTFADEYLSSITRPFVLITGKWHLPGLERTPTLEQILGHPQLAAWFSQNQIHDDLPIRPFPFGVNLSSLAEIWIRQKVMLFASSRRAGIFIPHVATHAHLSGVALSARKDLEPLMRERMPFAAYLDEILSSDFVLSPPGDRPDTYRHWESIALGAIPVSTLPQRFEELFAGHALLVDNLRTVAMENLPGHNAVPNPTLASYRYWKKKVRAAFP